MSKISIIGAGNVGATAARNIAFEEIADAVVLLDIKENLAEGKALDIAQSLIISNKQTRVVGVTNDYLKTSNSDIIIITSGVPRKPGMSREELVGINSKILNGILEQCDKRSPNAFYIIVSNPVDTLTLQAVNFFKHKKDTKIVGLGGLLDSARFRYYLAEELYAPAKYVSGIVLGGHGDKTMIPVFQSAYISGVPVEARLTEEQIQRVRVNTMNGGATITEMLGTSAWEAPAAAITAMANSVINNHGNIYPCSVYREDLNMCIGTRVVLGEKGVEKLIKDDISMATFSEKFHENVKVIDEVNHYL